MKKIGLLLAAFTLYCAGSFAQKQINDPNAQTRQVSGFHAIKVSNGIQVHIMQGNEEAVAVSASDPEFRDKMRTEVVNGVLKIYYDEAWWKQWSHTSRRNLRAYVSFKNLDMIDVSAGANVIAEGAVKTNSLKLEASSGASFHGKVDVNSMDADQSSGSVVEISGTVSGILKAEGSSGSIFRGYDLVVENCIAETSSGAGVQVTVNKELSVEASSGGFVHYKGNGLIRNVRTSSGGSVTRKS